MVKIGEGGDTADGCALGIAFIFFCFNWTILRMTMTQEGSKKMINRK